MKILITDDDLTSRSMLAGVLHNSGHEVLVTCSGSEAWQALQQPDTPRLVILDWLMPDMDGLDVLRRVRAVPTDRPSYIIMLTAKGDKADIVAGLAAGANDYLAKPFDPGELFARLEVGQRMIEMQDSLTSRTEKLRCAREDLRVLTAHLQSVREEERACLARELHDSFGQSLTALQMDLLWLDRQMSSAHIPDVALCCDKIVSMVPLVECLIEQTQTLCSSLRPNVLLELGLVAAIEWQTEDLTKRTGLICSLAMPASEVELDPEFALALFRISQEALTNVVRHAQATRIDVSLDFDEQHLELDIHDNGRGFPPEVTSGAGAGSLGLLGMRERAAVFVGTVDFLNDPAGGATVRVRVPIPCVTPLTPTGGPV